MVYVHYFILSLVSSDKQAPIQPTAPIQPKLEIVDPDYGDTPDTDRDTDREAKKEPCDDTSMPSFDLLPDLSFEDEQLQLMQWSFMDDKTDRKTDRKTVPIPDEEDVFHPGYRHGQSHVGRNLNTWDAAQMRKALRDYTARVNQYGRNKVVVDSVAKRWGIPTTTLWK